VFAIALSAGPLAHAEGDQVRPVRAERLPNVPGKKHHRRGRELRARWKIAQSSSCRSVRLCAVGRDPVGKLRDRTGQDLQGRRKLYFEPPGSDHLVSENASTTEPASLLAVFVADDGAQVTVFGRWGYAYCAVARAKST
jgi:hypothetical protein